MYGKYDNFEISLRLHVSPMNHLMVKSLLEKGLYLFYNHRAVYVSSAS